MEYKDAQEEQEKEIIMSPQEQQEEEENQCIMCDNVAYMMDSSNKKLFCNERCQRIYYQIDRIQSKEEQKNKLLILH